MAVRVSSPGKLFLAGEYAVVEAGYPAVIAAVSQRLYVMVTDSEVGLIHSSQQEDLWLKWSRVGNQLVAASAHPYSLVLAAMQVAEDYLRVRGQQAFPTYSLQITSDLDDKGSGVKYGLGSSGAVTVAVIKGVLQFFGELVSPLRLYQLAVIAQMRLQMTGSFGDLAASSFGGLIGYYSLDRQWLREAMGSYSLQELLAIPWPSLQIIPLSLPKGLDLLIGWTGRAASTEQLVDQVQGNRSKDQQEAAFQTFLKQSKSCVEGLISSLQEQDAASVQAALRRNRLLLQNLAQQQALCIETPALTKLCDIAEGHGAAAKSSGAGGGDCGICLLDAPEMRQALLTAWQRDGIQPLDIGIAYEE